MNPAGDPSPRRILVVDDNVDAAAGISMLMQVCGHQVHMVHRGREVLDAALAHDAEIVFLDIGLPDIDGYEVARTLRQHPRARHLRLIAISGFGNESEQQGALAAGFDGYLTKPAELAQLQAALGS